MENNKNNRKHKKGFLSAIWESMTKTGGCCGGGGDCCDSPQLDADKQKEATKKNSPASCCGK